MERSILHMHLISGIGPATIMYLYNALAGDVSSIYWYTENDVQRLGIRKHTAQALVSGLRETRALYNELRLLEQYNISCVTIHDAAYPRYVRAITTPPPVLYYYGGDITQLDNSVAIVGSRKSGSYARSVVNQIVPSLVEHGYTLVSGGAYGADTLVHKHTLTAGGKTAAILGSGLLCPYPARNKRLFDEIAASGGLVVSPFALREQAQAYHFPTRNRIIAGASKGVIVVQAARKSGTRITAAYALEEGREVGAVPGPITDPLSEGVHSLLQNGAYPITSAYDVIALCDGDSAVQHTLETAEESNVATEDPVVRACIQPHSFDALLAQTGLSFHDLQTRLLQLQMSGKIAQDVSGCWYTC